MTDQKKPSSWGHRLREENSGLKDKIANLKKENARLKRDLEKVWDLMAHVPGGIFLLRQETISYANEAASHWLGYRAGELLGKNLLDIIDPEDAQPVIDLIQGKTGMRTPDALRFKTAEGKSIYCAVHLRKTRYEGRKAFLLNLIEIDRKFEQEKAYLELERFRSLKKMAAALVREWTSVENCDHPLLVTLRNYAKETYHPSEVSLLDLNRVIKTSVMHYCAENGIPYDKRPDARNPIALKSALNHTSPINGSPKDLQMAFTHLVANAVEALKKPGEIYLTVQEESGFINVYVQENGCGIQMDVADHIYDPFFSTKGCEHKGLGLSIARAVIERHGGTIRALHHEAGGTTFHVKLPRYYAPLRRDDPIKKKSIKTARILLFGDPNLLNNALCRFFSSKHLNLYHIDRYDDCFKALKSRRYDLMLLDDGKSPSKTAWLIRKTRRSYPNVPIALYNISERIDAHATQKPETADLMFSRPLYLEGFYDRVSRLILDGDHH